MSIPVAILKGRTGFLVVLFSLFLFNRRYPGKHKMIQNEYTTYIDLIADFVQDKGILSLGMMREAERVEKVIERALTRKFCVCWWSGHLCHGRFCHCIV